MRIGSSRAHGTLRQLVRLKSVPYDVERTVDRNKDRFGESASGRATVSGVEMYLYEPQETTLETDFGERLQGDIEGLALPSADIEQEDRVTHLGDKYEVERIMHYPDNGNPVLKRFTLQKVTNE